MFYIRERSQTHEETYSFSVAHEIGDVQKIFSAVSVGPEGFGLDPKKLEAKMLDFPYPLVELSKHYLRGPGVFEIRENSDPRAYTFSYSIAPL